MTNTEYVQLKNLFRYGDLDNREDPKGPVLFQHPLGVAWNSKSQRIYVTDSYNHKIKIVDPVAKVSYTYCGNGKAGLSDGTLDRDEIQVKTLRPSHLSYVTITIFFSLLLVKRTRWSLYRLGP